jgi:hypothetical protein
MTIRLMLQHGVEKKEIVRIGQRMAHAICADTSYKWEKDSGLS